LKYPTRSNIVILLCFEPPTEQLQTYKSSTYCTTHVQFYEYDQNVALKDNGNANDGNFLVLVYVPCLEI